MRIRLITFFLAGLLIGTKAYSLEILAAGDSITQGLMRNAYGLIYGITSPLNGAANIGAYLPGLKSLLDAQIENSNIYNWGKGGENSAQAVLRINTIISSRTADIILIMYGANDIYQGVSSSSTKENLRYMITKSRAIGLTPIISEITPNSLFDSYIVTSYNPQIEALATEENVPMALMHNRLNDGWTTVPYTSGDGLHLNTTGYSVMTDEWFTQIQSLFETPVPEPEQNIVPLLEMILLRN